MALKELVLPTPEAIAETEHEVQLMKLLNHPFLVRMFDSFAIDTYYYILMEVAQGIYIYIYIITIISWGHEQCT